LLEKEVGQVWVTGEITNLKPQPSGHIYFTLKDAGAQFELRAVSAAKRKWTARFSRTGGR